MNNKEYTRIILQEFTHTLSSIGEVQAERFVQPIDEADKVFYVGTGGNGFQVKGFTVRLMHMGVTSYVVGETCTPNAKESGVLVVCSGSGEIKSLVSHTAKAKEMGARVALITINPNSSATNMMDVVIEISAPSPKNARQEDTESIQPMGSLLEQNEGIFTDIAVMTLTERRGEDSNTTFGRRTSMG